MISLAGGGVFINGQNSQSHGLLPQSRASRHLVLRGRRRAWSAPTGSPSVTITYWGTTGLNRATVAIPALFLGHSSTGSWNQTTRFLTVALGAHSDSTDLTDWESSVNRVTPDRNT